MTSEVTRFTLARAIRRPCPDDRKPGIRLSDWLRNSELLSSLRGAEPGERRAVAESWAGSLPADELGSIAELPIPHADRLAALDAWLTCQDNLVDPPDLIEAIRRFLDREVATGSTTGAFEDADPLFEDARLLAEMLLLASILGAPPGTQQVLMRAVLVLALVERVLLLDGAVRTVDDVSTLLRERLVFMPPDIFPLPYRSAVVRRPGFADLHVVRQEWHRYVAGEIAHVENVLPHELKRHGLTTTDETETTETIETEHIEEVQRDLQSTSRFELADQTSADTTLTVHVEGQVDTSGQYGPTKVDTHLGGSLDFTEESSERHATQQANETVARAVKRVEDRVRQARTVRSLTRVVDENVHEQNNTDDSAVVGMYRWIDKIVRLQRFRLPHRYLLEFEVPEPAAYLRWREARGRDRGFTNPLPTPLTLNGQLESDVNPTLIPTDVSADPAAPGYYLRLAARWHANGIESPPPDTVVASGWLTVPASDPSEDKTSHEVWVTPLEGSAGAGGAGGGADGEPVVVPDGYLADANWNGWLMTWDQDDSIRPAYNPNGNTWEDVPPVAYVTLGDSQNDPADNNATQRNRVVAARSAVSIPIGGALNGRRTGRLPIVALVQNYGFLAIQIHVTCRRQAEGALLRWQLDTYNRLRAAYFELLRAHEEERSARAIQAGVVVEGRSPLENARIVREELKRQVIELLLGRQFSGVDAVDRDAEGRPSTDIAAAVAAAPLLQFLEQVFEWENLTYVLYPYFWADASQWDDLADISGPDPDYARFLRAGSARVVLSARPGYSGAVEYFLWSGIPWAGWNAPCPEKSTYISVADEIQAQTAAPVDGTPAGPSWEVRLPTTLVCLDPDPNLPKINADATLPAPPA